MPLLLGLRRLDFARGIRRDDAVRDRRVKAHAYGVMGALDGSLGERPAVLRLAGEHIGIRGLDVARRDGLHAHVTHRV